MTLGGAVMISALVPASAQMMIGFWAGLQVYNIVFGGTDNTAWWAHIGGFVAGMILIPLMKRKDVPLFDRGRYRK